MAGRVLRSLLAAAADRQDDAWAILTGTAPTLRFDARGRTRELVPLDLSGDDMFSPVVSDG